MKRHHSDSNSSLAPIVIAGVGGGLVGLLISMTILSSQGQTTSWKMILFGSSGAASAVLGAAGCCLWKQQQRFQQQQLNTRFAALETRPAPPIESTVRSQAEPSQDRASATDLAMIKPVGYGVAVEATQTLLVADAMSELHQRRLDAGYLPLDVTTLLQPMTEQQMNAAECFEQDRETLNAVQQSIPELAGNMSTATNGSNGAAAPQTASFSNPSEEEMIRQSVIEPELEEHPFLAHSPLESDRGYGASSNGAMPLDHDLAGSVWDNSSLRVP